MSGLGRLHVSSSIATNSLHDDGSVALDSASNSPPSIQPHLTTMSTSTWFQKTLKLPSRSRGSYLITSDITSALSPELSRYRVGLLTLFIQHTSCALSLNENWDADVRADMSDALDRIVVEGEGIYRHDAEGSDDMPVCCCCCSLKRWVGEGRGKG